MTPAQGAVLENVVGGALTAFPGLREGVTVQVDGTDLVLGSDGRTTRLRGIPEALRSHLTGEALDVDEGTSRRPVYGATPTR